MKTTVEVNGIAALPKAVKEEPTREQLALQVICSEKYDEDADYFYDVDGHTIYAKAESGIWKITCEDIKFLALSKN
jgi:hypothetical protein